MTDVFVALGNVDLERVNRILTVLRMRGYRVWVPQNTERKALTDERAHALRKAKCGVALWSSSSPASKSVPIFANYANEKGILINVPVDDAKIPPELDAHEALDLSDWHSNEEDGFRRLEERIRPFTRPSPEKFSLGAALVESKGSSSWSVLEISLRPSLQVRQSCPVCRPMVQQPWKN